MTAEQQPTEPPGTEPIALYPQHSGAPIETVIVPVHRPRLPIIAFDERIYVRNANGRYEEAGYLTVYRMKEALPAPPDPTAVFAGGFGTRTIFAKSDPRDKQAREALEAAAHALQQGGAGLRAAETADDALQAARARKAARAGEPLPAETAAVMENVGTNARGELVHEEPASHPPPPAFDPAVGEHQPGPPVEPPAPKAPAHAKGGKKK
jgi:hypothetical protein